MKSTLIPTVKPPVKIIYPTLFRWEGGVATGEIVLATDKIKGIVIVSTDTAYPVGHVYNGTDGWEDIPSWKHLDEPVTITFQP